MIDLTQVTFHSSPLDIADWTQGVQITSLEMQPTGAPKEGLSFTFDKMNWPDYTPVGWTGPIQYTVWALASIGGQWHGAGFIQMWRGRPSTGAPMLTDFHKNWAYAPRWGALADYVPKAGDTMGFFVSAGNARDTSGVTSVRERSNVISVVLPANDTGRFAETAPDSGGSVVVPSEPQMPDFAADLAAINKKLDALAAAAAIKFPDYSGNVFGYRVTLTPSK